MTRGENNVFQSFTNSLLAGQFFSTGAGFRGDLGRYYNSPCSNQLLECLFPGHFTASGGGY